MKNNNADLSLALFFWNTIELTKSKIFLCYYPQRLAVSQRDLIVLHSYLVFREFYSSEIVVRYLLLFKNKGTLCSSCSRDISIPWCSKLSLIYSLFRFMNTRSNASDIKPQNVILIYPRVPLLTGELVKNFWI